MTDIFRECRENVTALQAAERYGLEVRRGWALCCFHADKKPSLHFHDGIFKCFACNEAGDSVAFVSKYFGISPLDACKRLNTDFSLGLVFDAPTTKESQRAARERREIQEAHKRFEKWRQQTINDLNACHRLGYRAEPPFSDRDVLAIKQKDYFAYLADLLMDGTPDEQISIFRQRGGVERLTQQILQCSQTK